MRYSNIYLKKEEEDAHMMNMLLESVITYAMDRPDPFGIKTVNINEVVTNITDEIHHKNIHPNCKFIIKDELPVIQGVSSSLIYQVFENLMENAVKFNKSDNPDVRISWSETANEYIFSISDNGIGISPINYNNLFNIFDHKVDSKQCSGKKIGLVLCKKIIEHYGGKIWVESFLEQGSTFYFTIRKAKATQKNDHLYMPFSIEDASQQRNIA